MRRLVWKGGGVLDEGGELVADGCEFTVSDERAEQLLERADVADADVLADLARASRADLNALAAAAGVESPEALPNKDAVIAAIHESEAQQGAGQPEEPAAGSTETPEQQED